VKINSYSFGSIVIDGKTYTKDIIVSDNVLNPNWWRKEGHSLAVEDIKEILEDECEVIVIGTGYDGEMVVPLETKKHIESLGIDIITKKTTEAVKTYNKLLEDGRKVIGAFHLTC
jgi:hypothetical protein